MSCQGPLIYEASGYSKHECVLVYLNEISTAGNSTGKRIWRLSRAKLKKAQQAQETSTQDLYAQLRKTSRMVNQLNEMMLTRRAARTHDNKSGAAEGAASGAGSEEP